MSPVIAFLLSPLGGILIAEVPDLVGKIIKIAHETGKVTPQEWMDFINSQKQWDDIKPAQ